LQKLQKDAGIPRDLKKQQKYSGDSLVLQTEVVDGIPRLLSLAEFAEVIVVLR
jgi:hypothetical protein